MSDELLTTTQFVAAVGVTYRVLDYWIRCGVFTPTVEADGSGSRRRFDPATVPLVRTLGRVQNALDRSQMGVSTVLLGEIYDAMERGQDYLDLSDNVVLSWDREP